MIYFKTLPDSDKPRERLFKNGADNLSNEELISIILKTGIKGKSVKEVSLNLLQNINDINYLKDIGINTLMKIDGIGKVKAIEIKAAIELGRRVYSIDNPVNKIKLNSSLIIYNNFKCLFEGKKQELFYCIYVDTQCRYIDKKCLFIGTLNNSIVHPREVFKEGYLLSANGIICMHNHPSGDVMPSREDVIITNKLKEIGLIHGIKIIDHIIFGNNSYYSFYDDKKI